MTCSIAKPADCLHVFELSNDPVVRSVSFDSDVIVYSDHEKWFEARLKDPSCLFLVFYELNALVAQVRFSKIDTISVRISISVSSAFRNKGLGLIIMQEAISQLRAIWTVSKIKAMVKSDNEASNIFFIKAGYYYFEKERYKGCECNVYYYNL